jgi:hypothetical protein
VPEPEAQRQQAVRQGTRQQQRAVATGNTVPQRANIGGITSNGQNGGVERYSERDIQQTARLAARAQNEHGKIDRNEIKLDANPATRGSVTPELAQLRQDDLATHREYNGLVSKLRAEGYQGTFTPPQMPTTYHTQRAKLG